MKTDEEFDHSLQKKLDKRQTAGLLRSLSVVNNGVDFSSNDYLGLARSEALNLIDPIEKTYSGATGSRLISGNSIHAEETEKRIAAFHDAEAALIFNSGYAANMGLLSCIASPEDAIILDEYAHASLIDGFKLSKGILLKFRHNDLNDLEKKLHYPSKAKLVVIESLYSMHGDQAPIEEIVALCKRYRALLIVDEAHATGVYGKKGEGLVCQYGLQKSIYARIHTFGKALGLHGAAIVGSTTLRNYLINYARSFIYTTALPPDLYKKINIAYQLLPSANRKILTALIQHFQSIAETFKEISFVASHSPIQGIVVGDNFRAKSLADHLQQKGFLTKAILSPTLPKGSERIRICLHSFNTKEEIESLLSTAKNKIT